MSQEGFFWLFRIGVASNLKQDTGLCPATALVRDQKHPKAPQRWGQSTQDALQCDGKAADGSICPL